MDEPMVVIGEISAPQGNKGEVRVYPLTDFPERFTTMTSVTWEKDGTIKVLSVEACRFHKNMPVLHFTGYNSIGDAQTLVGGKLKVSPQETVTLSPGHYYFYEIVGLQVYTTQGEHLGQVKDIFRTGSNDVYVVQRTPAPDGAPEPELLLPAIKDVIKEIDPAAGRILIELLDGLV